MFSSNPSAALEYWFFKLNQGTTSLLVDWIARRRTGRGTLRVSVHSDRGTDVFSTDEQAALVGGPDWLNSMATKNDQGDVRWDLAISASQARIEPGLAIAKKAGLFDLTYESAPELTFDGWIEYHGERIEVNAARGMAAHYWGPRLMPDWWWISAKSIRR